MCVRCMLYVVHLQYMFYVLVSVSGCISINFHINKHSLAILDLNIVGDAHAILHSTTFSMEIIRAESNWSEDRTLCAGSVFCSFMTNLRDG